ncbi:SDR family NAD(P)-dependent oxidoreductase [Dactylosporangium sp. NPDC005572]|uniref:SDR family NAD(P)-dependent oxidoreductase n=1 Tax=Dactylosporangium sp. NPDC005572 TaxID=3156889 RepID=UPI0033B41029
MSNFLVTGGTDGIGREVARRLLRRGDRVMTVGRDAAKAVDGATFVRADLSRVADAAAVAERTAAHFPVLDGIVLCARHYRSARTETPDGFEENFALFYLSRYLLGHHLVEHLEHAERPVIANVAGPGSAAPIPWDDLQLRAGYAGGAALGLGGRYNDLLGAAYAERHPAARTRYLLFHPGIVATSFSGEYDPATRAHVDRLRRSGRPPARAAAEILARMDAPPPEPLSAYVEGVRIGVATPAFDRRDALRLDRLTRDLLGEA